MKKSSIEVTIDMLSLNGLVNEKSVGGFRNQLTKELNEKLKDGEEMDDKAVLLFGMLVWEKMHTNKPNGG